MCYNNISSNNNNNINNKQIMSNNIINSNSIKDNFRTPLTPLHRGGLGGLHKCRLKGIYSRGLEVLAFSLIELSIVLIIIGLLVAGVTGGKSLIESAKTRALMNEIRGYKQAVNTYYAARGRLPGDKNNIGRIDDKDEDGLSPNSYYDRAVAFYDLNKEGIVDFDKDTEPHPYMGKPSNIYKNAFYSYVTFVNGDVYDNDVWYSGDVYDNLNGHFLGLHPKYLELIPIRVTKSIDEKIDDGIFNEGNVRGWVSDDETLDEGAGKYYYNDGDPMPYDDAMKSKENPRTTEIMFKLDI